LTICIRPGPVCTERDRACFDADADHLFLNPPHSFTHGLPGAVGGKSRHCLELSGPSSKKVNDLGLTDDQILAGKPHPSPWFEASINPASKTISVIINVNFRFDSGGARLPNDPGRMMNLNPGPQEPTAEQQAKLIALAQQGVAKFWSRTIDLNGDTYHVNVSLNLTKDGMNVRLKLNDSNNPKNYKRSYNTKGTNSPLSIPGAIIFYQPGFYKGDELRANKDFEITVAHELGHSVLTIAGGVGFSWGHEGTSTVLGGNNGKKLQTPATGEIDLMKYYNGLFVDVSYERSIASESDVKNLIYISTRPNH
jgi:hypothetical protein